MTEILVHPYRHGGQNCARDYYSLLVSYPNLAWIPTDLRIADRAARLRADYRMRRPDAIQAATATVFWATGLVTNDRIFARVPDFETLVFDDVS
jgi:predicted nucleic acid-binding protein